MLTYLTVQNTSMSGDTVLTWREREHPGIPDMAKNAGISEHYANDLRWFGQQIL